MKWDYRRYRVESSRTCPSGIVFRPEAKLRVRGTRGETYLRALIDTGADHSILPMSVADDIGATLFEDELQSAQGVSGHEITIIPGQVELALMDDNESHEWTAVVGFTRFASSVDECNVLGYSGCLEFFSATFDGNARFVELTSIADLRKTE